MNYHPSCVRGTGVYKKHVEEIQIFEFLASLNWEYEQVQVQILGKEPLPFLSDAYSYIQREE